MRVGAKSDVKSLASAVTHALYVHPSVQLRAIGAGAVNQAIKALAIARRFLAPGGLELYVVPDFATVPTPASPKLATRLRVRNSRLSMRPDARSRRAAS